MDSNKFNPSSIGGMLAFFGLFSSVLSFFGYNLKILMWIDSWGPTVGWIIRIGLILVGGALFFLFREKEEEIEVNSETE